MRNPQNLMLEMTTLWMSSMLVANARLAQMWLPATHTARAGVWEGLFAEKAEAAAHVQFAATTAMMSGLDALAITEASLKPITKQVELNLRAITGSKSVRSRGK